MDAGVMWKVWVTSYKCLVPVPLFAVLGPTLGPSQKGLRPSQEGLHAAFCVLGARGHPRSEGWDVLPTRNRIHVATLPQVVAVARD